MVTTADKVYKIRTALNLNMAEFAAPLKINFSYISQIESGTKNPSDRLVKSILSEYRISSEWWNAGTGPMFRAEEEKVDPADMALISEIRRSPEKYLAAKELAKMHDDDVFGVRAEIRRAAVARKD